MSVWKDEDKNGPLGDRQDQEEPGNIHIAGSDDEDAAHTRTLDSEGRPIPVTPPRQRAAPSTSSSRPPSTHDDDDDLDALIARIPQHTQPNDPPEDDGFDDSMWDIADEIQLGATKQPSAAPSNHLLPDEDEDDMWMDLARQTGGTSPTLRDSADGENTNNSKPIANDVIASPLAVKSQRPMLESDLGDLYD